MAGGEQKLVRRGAGSYRAHGERSCGAFTIVDLLVSLAVILILIGIMLPSIRRARETALQVVCGSNVRQQGLGLMMYSQDYQQRFPPTLFAPESEGGTSAATAAPRADQMVIVRVGNVPGDWDGLGFLFSNQYLDASRVFYCPAHQGDHPSSRYERQWLKPVGVIVSNYQYRGPDSVNAEAHSALVVDALRTKRDFSHRVGANVLRADFSVVWIGDSDRQVINSLPDSEFDDEAGVKVDAAWDLIDAEVQSAKK